MINIKAHAKKRYCERILGMTEETEIKRHIAANDQQLIAHMNAMFDHSTFIWKGQLGDNITRNFRINGDVILVCDTDETVIVTLYRIDFGYPEATNKKVIKDLVKEISALQDKREKAETQINTKVERRRMRVEQIDAEIRELEARTEALRARKAAEQQDIAAMFKEVAPMMRQIETFGTMLCNSLAYKQDLLAIKAG